MDKARTALARSVRELTIASAGETAGDSSNAVTTPQPGSKPWRRIVAARFGQGNENERRAPRQDEDALSHTIHSLDAALDQGIAHRQIGKSTEVTISGSQISDAMPDTKRGNLPQSRGLGL